MVYLKRRRAERRMETGSFRFQTFGPQPKKMQESQSTSFWWEHFLGKVAGEAHLTQTRAGTGSLYMHCMRHQREPCGMDEQVHHSSMDEQVRYSLMDEQVHHFFDGWTSSPFLRWMNEFTILRWMNKFTILWWMNKFINLRWINKFTIFQNWKYR